MGRELPKVTQHVRGRALHITSWALRTGLCHLWDSVSPSVPITGLMIWKVSSCAVSRVPAPLRIHLLDGVEMDYPSVIWPPEWLAVPTTAPQAFLPPPTSPSFLSLRASPACYTADSGSHRCLCSWPTSCHPGRSAGLPASWRWGLLWQGPQALLN